MYNIKLIKKIIFYILRLNNEKIKKEKIDQILADEIKCLSLEEIHVKKIFNSLNYIFNNFTLSLNKELLNEIYYLLSNSILESEIADSIVGLYYQNIDNSVYYLVAVIHLFIINNISRNKIEFAFCVSQLIMQKKNKTMLIPYEFLYSDYKKAIMNNNFSLLVRLMYDMEYFCEKKIPCKYSKNEIIQKIKLSKEHIIIKFNVHKLYLFGSFAKGTNNENSDIDFLVILDEDLINIERLEQISLLKEYLSKLFECSVDILDFTFALKELGENEMENIITLL